MTDAAFALPDPPDLDLGDAPVDPAVPTEVAALADAYGCSVADMVRWIVEDDGPEGVDLDLAVRSAGGDDAAEMAREERLETIGWRITDPALAEWALAKLNEARAQAHVVHRQADDFAAPHHERLRRVDEWRANALRRPLADAAFFKAHLERWGRIVREATGSATLSLPSGSIETRTVPAAAVPTDQRELVRELAAEHGWTDDDFKVERSVPARTLNQRATVGWRHVAELSCGHYRDFGDAPPPAGEDVGCSHCADSAEAVFRGDWPERPIVAVEARPAVWINGVDLEHAHVRPERLSITVRTDVLPPPGEPQ